MKRSVWIHGGLISLLTIFLIVCLYAAYFYYQSGEIIKQYHPTTSVTILDDTIFPQLRRKIIKEQYANQEETFEIPIHTNPRVTQLLESFAENLVLQASKNSTQQLGLQYQILQANDNVVSIKYELQHIHSDLIQKDYEYRTVNIQTGSFLKLEELLKNSETLRLDNSENFGISDQELLYEQENRDVAVPLNSLLLNLNTENFTLINAPLSKLAKKEQFKTTAKQTIQNIQNSIQANLQPISNRCQNQKCIALTFDDGPALNTDSILEILKKEEVKATFYVTGNSVKKHPEILKRIHFDTHEIGNHSLSHANFSKLTPEEITIDLIETQEAIYRIIGQYPATFRPPYGVINEDIRQNLFLPSIMWDVDSQDWRTKNPASIQTEINSQVKTGSIILLHDIHAETTQALPGVIQNLKQQGYVFVAVSELINLQATDLTDKPIISKQR